MTTDTHPSEVYFYHLERQTIENVLPQLLERTLTRGWRACVQATTAERIDALNAHLWTYRADSFLPHGTRQDGFAEAQPVFLTIAADNPNKATVRFLIDGAEPEQWQGYQRFVVLFDGRDEGARNAARTAWKSAKAQGCEVTYWQQEQDGRWERKG